MWIIVAMCIFISTYKHERKTLNKGTRFLPETKLERRDDLLHSESLEELHMIIQWERKSVELDVPVAEHKVNV
jgi:hypothetical protein